ncbi:spermidine synthase [Paucibacter sp. TC2R-5]|uniref:spermine/spermidine synthase domain-containing protein n=1 Tax=Paucibacter sp. TC2R-5 TaxID=2893555 RepID=UPI0021E4529E|nr:MnmC family methyltransferase [Paucibacter sp. TC2R-5]MCV2359852.1 spermidine synthase [Paucibacter sp. TC2R-5]
MRAIKRGEGAALALMLASGFAGLGYQIVWTQQAGLWLGHESAAVLAVIAAFFGGLSLGALGLGARIERSLHPLRWYAAMELIIAAWGVALILLMAPASAALLTLTGARPSPAWQWTIAFAGSFILLLPATVAMGATLPALERVMAQWRSAGRSIATLYASNTAGAVLGVLASAFWLIPTLGLSSTAVLCVLLNLLCAAGAMLLLRGPALARADLASNDSPAGQGSLLMRLALTGLLGIGYEVMVVRLLSQVTEDTVYTFAMLLAVYLIGTAAGAVLWQMWQRRLRPEGSGAGLTDRLLAALALACLLGAASLWAAEGLRAMLLSAFGPGMAAAMAVEAALAVAAFALPTLVMGALFSQLCAQAAQAGLSFGRAIGFNTLGAALAPLLFGVLLTPLLGIKWALLLIPLGYLALIQSKAWLRPITLMPAAACLALALLTPPLAFIEVPEGGRIVSYQEGAMAAVSVVEDAQGVSRLRINNRQQEGSSSSLWFDARQALLPLLLHPAPKQSLFLGLGTGMTAASAAQDPTLRVDAVELLPEVISASGHFTQTLNEGQPQANLQLIAADARRYVRAAATHYDVIISDNFHPARSGSGSLYTVEHFQAVRARLAPGGLFCQWLPLHQLDLASLRSIVQAFLIANPAASAILANNSLETPVLGLIGRQTDGTGGFTSLAAARARLDAAAFKRPPAQFGIEDEFALLGSFVAGPAALKAFAGDVAANTDDHPVVAHLAPRITYAPDSAPRERLLDLLSALSIEPADLLSAHKGSDTDTDSDSTARLSAYWQARRQFIEAGRHIQPSSDLRAMLAQVEQPLFKVLQLSPDFRPAYDPLLRMAQAMAGSDPVKAQQLLRKLQRVQPARQEAGELLLGMGANGEVAQRPALKQASRP